MTGPRVADERERARLAEALARLRAQAAEVSSEREAREILARTAQLARAYKARHRIGVPATLLDQAVELDPRYRRRPHLTYLSDRLAAAVADVEAGRNRMIAVSMPPRSGKSTLLSLYGPAWLLRLHPEWEIVNASHDPALATKWAGGVREMIETVPELGIVLKRDGGASGYWETIEGGGLYAVGVRGSLTGRGAKVMIIDDPVKDFAEAHSQAIRKALWDWWRSVAFLRLEAPYLVLVVMCMTGDTPVSMADGTERALRDVRPGDEIATYENGQVTTAPVRRWASQGPDKIFRIRMESGRTVRANARHPFLTISEDGTEAWRRTSELRPGTKIVAASSTGVTDPRSPVASAGLTTNDSLPTWNVTVDRVVEVIPAGIEDVFDIQVDRTESFIAGGLIAHNTRWHEDDLVGRLFSPDHEGDPADWERISVPAIAEDDDIIGRRPGQPLLSPLSDEDEAGALARTLNIRTTVGSYVFTAMHQQRPSPAKGAIFDTGWWRYWTRFPERATADGLVVHLDPGKLTGGRWLDSWDASFDSESETSSWVVGQRWVRSGPDRFLIAQRRGRWSFTETLAEMLAWAETNDPVGSPCGGLVHQRLVEKKANGAAIIDVLKRKLSGIKPITPKESKVARARAVTPECESHNVFLPYPGDPGNEWVQDFLAEVRDFPNGMADDQVDGMTQALAEFRDENGGKASVPGNTLVDGKTMEVVRDLTNREALTSLRRQITTTPRRRIR